MTLPYIPGPEATLGPAFQQLTENVLHFLNPEKRFQDAVLAGISRDPSLVQKFADLEATSPGILKQLGIPGLGSAKPSPEAEFAAKEKDRIVAGKSLALTGQIESDKLKNERLKQALDLLKTRPDISLDSALQLVTGQTSAQRTVAEEEAKQAPLRTEAAQIGLDIAKAEKPTKIAQADLTNKGITIAQQMLTEGPDVTLDRFMRGEFTNEQLLALASTPFLDILKMQLDDHLTRLRIQAQTTGDNDALERFKMGHALSLFMATNGAGTPEAAMKYLFEGGAAIAASLADKPEASLTPEQRALVSIGKSLEQSKRLETSKFNQQIYQKINTAIGEFRRLSTDRRVDDQLLMLQANLINSYLTEAGAGFSVTYEDLPSKLPFTNIKIPGTSHKELVFRDVAGNIVDESRVLASLQGAAPQAQAPTSEIPAEFKPYVDTYNALQTPGEKEAALARWRAELASRPDLIRQLEIYLGIRQ